MNRFLAKVTAAANAAVAFSIIIACLFIGRQIAPDALGFEAIYGLWIGLAFGLILALAVCGATAQLSDIRRLLEEIRDQGEDPS